MTGAGLRLLARFKPAMEEMEAAVSDARDLRAKPTGTVRLHMPCPAYAALLEPVLGLFHRTYQDILLEVVIDDAVVDIVAAGFDLSVRARALAEPSMSAVAARLPKIFALSALPVTYSVFRSHNGTMC